MRFGGWRDIREAATRLRRAWLSALLWDTQALEFFFFLILGSLATWRFSRWSVSPAGLEIVATLWPAVCSTLICLGLFLRSDRLRVLGAVAAALYWCYLAVLELMVTPLRYAPWVDIHFAVASLWVVVGRTARWWPTRD